jgi:cyclophilin family peptidyl-prolyl cis-trans isomerase
MAARAARCNRVRSLGIFAAGFVVLALAGCNRQGEETQVDYKPETPVKAETNLPPKVPLDPRLHQPMKEATYAEPPEGQLLPEKTKTGLPASQLFLLVEKEWDGIHFVTDDGKKLLYKATLKTALGDIPIELFPEKAPNHVRSFVALSRAKYYDGLAFDYVLPAPVELLIGGCPKGTFDQGYGSIGYWLKPEKNDQKHEPGAVGAFHEREADTAACKFYISLKNARELDDPTQIWTIFGQTTPEGLAVARKIAAQKRSAADVNRPQEPVTIQNVSIEVREGGPVAPPPEKKQP